MTPMPKPELPPEAMYWTAFNESDALSIIMRAQNYITEELIRRGRGERMRGRNTRCAARGRDAGPPGVPPGEQPAATAGADERSECVVCLWKHGK